MTGDLGRDVVGAGHRMCAEAAIELLGALRVCGADPCVGGGWAVDALLGRQTRPHADLDLWLPAAELDPLIVALAQRGVDRLLPWGGDRPWNFVLHDGGHRRIDLHLYEALGNGRLHYGSVLTGVTFPAAHLDGSGSIGGATVRCETIAWALTCHTGYSPRVVDRQDVGLLCAAYGLDLPTEYR